MIDRQTVSAQNPLKVLLADHISERRRPRCSHGLPVDGGRTLAQASAQTGPKDKVSKVKEERSSKCLSKDGERNSEGNLFGGKCVLDGDDGLVGGVLILASSCSMRFLF